MAARNHHVLKQTFRLFSSRSTSEGLAVLPADEFDESDVWGCHQPAESRPADSSRNLTVPSSRATWSKSTAGTSAASGASLPVKVPDWSKILLHEYKGNNGSSKNRGFEEEEEEEEGEGAVIPPHEVVWRRREASSSVEEGIGRTLKGRDLSRVRNAIWAKTGFQD